MLLRTYTTSIIINHSLFTTLKHKVSIKQFIFTRQLCLKYFSTENKPRALLYHCLDCFIQVRNQNKHDSQVVNDTSTLKSVFNAVIFIILIKYLGLEKHCLVFLPLISLVTIPIGTYFHSKLKYPKYNSKNFCLDSGLSIILVNLVTF